MSKKQNNSLRNGLLAALGGIAIGVVGAIVGSKLIEDSMEKQPPVEEYRLPPRKKRIFDQKGKEQITHSPDFEENLECPISQGKIYITQS